MLADLNRNGTIGDGGEVIAAAVQGRDPGSTFWQTGEVNLGDGPVSFAFQELAAQARASWKLGATGARRGQVQVGGVDYALHLLDGDFDGRYSSAADWWWFGPLPRLGKFTQLRGNGVRVGLLEGRLKLRFVLGATNRVDLLRQSFDSCQQFLPSRGRGGHLVKLTFRTGPRAVHQLVKPLLQLLAT